VRALLDASACGTSHRNFYEASRFPDGTVSADFANRLSRALSLPATATGPVALPALRATIAQFRTKFAAQLSIRGTTISDHITPDLARLVELGGQ
jgi:hypothetical protein